MKQNMNTSDVWYLSHINAHPEKQKFIFALFVKEFTDSMCIKEPPEENTFRKKQTSKISKCHLMIKNKSN